MLRVNLEENLKALQDSFQAPDLVVRRFQLAAGQYRGAVAYLDSIADATHVMEGVLEPFLRQRQELPSAADPGHFWDQLSQRLLEGTNISHHRSMADLIAVMNTGHAAILLDQVAQGLSYDCRDVPVRAIEEPAAEATIRGSRDGFVEDIQQNLALIRNRVRHPRFKVLPYTIGRYSQTRVLVLYIDGLARDEIVAEVKRRLADVDLEHVPDSAFIERAMEDGGWTLFPRVQITARPDRVSSALVADGRIAVLVEGSPEALIVPMTLPLVFQAADDYYFKWQIASLARALRFLAGFTALGLTPLYAALTTFHPGLIPTPLILSLSAARQALPYPAVVEISVMLIILEMFVETGLRLPKPLGPAVTIVGGIVLGQAAVAAALISPVVVIVISLTAIVTFIIPNVEFVMAVRFYRLLILAAAMLLGLFGMMLALIILYVNISRITSFGVPYHAPVAPFIPTDWKDVITRPPTARLGRRPQTFRRGSPDAN